MSNHGLAIAQQLAAASLGLTLGTDVFNGRAIEQPARGVFCLAHGGRPPDDIVGNAAAPEISYQYPRVQIVVREVQQSFGSGETLAKNVRKAVHLKVPAGYIDCRAIESAPLYLGEDDLGRHVWSINVELTIRE